MSNLINRACGLNHSQSKCKICGKKTKYGWWAEGKRMCASCHLEWEKGHNSTK